MKIKGRAYFMVANDVERGMVVGAILKCKVRLFFKYPSLLLGWRFEVVEKEVRNFFKDRLVCVKAYGRV